MAAKWKTGMLTAVLIGAAALGAAGQVRQPMIGEAAPPFRLQALDGKVLALADLRGKFVVLHFGAGW